MRVIASPPDLQAFSAFGAFLTPPSVAGERALFSEWVRPVPELSQQCHLNRVTPSEFPVRVDQVEHHPHTAQVFLPIGVSRYLVTVMPSDDSGAPDPSGTRSFVLPGTSGVAYRAGVWHTGITVLDTAGSFAVLMWRGAADDDVFADIGPLEIHPPTPARVGPAHG